MLDAKDTFSGLILKPMSYVSLCKRIFLNTCNKGYRAIVGTRTIVFVRFGNYYNRGSFQAYGTFLFVDWH